MKRHITYGTIFIVSFLFLSFSNNTGEININIIRERMDNALNAISIGVENHELFEILKNHIEFETLRRIIDRSKISSNIIFSSKIDYSKPFLTSLVYDTEEFENFVKFFRIKRIPLSAFFNLLDASSDLEVKARVIKTSNTDTVEVTVNTIDQYAKEINHCTVWYVPYLKDSDPFKIRFDQLSTPTTDLVPAGLWKIWTEKNGKMGPKTRFQCGHDGRKKREIDILAPNENGDENECDNRRNI